MVSTTAHIRWSDLELTMRDFVDDFRDSLPVIVVTKTGYSGYDEDIHQIGAGEIYWIYEIQRQKRFVGRQITENKFLSIPSDYPLNVQLLNNGKLGPAKSLRDLSKLFDTRGEPIEIQFENNQTVSFQVGADIGNSTQFGTLSIEDTYEEKYLLGYTIHGGEIFSKTVSLPVYMDITVSVADGLTCGDEFAFDGWMKEMKKVAGRFTSTPAKMCQEIILFSEMPSSGQYEYLKPAQIANLQQTNTPLIDGKSTPPGKQGDEKKLNVYVTRPERLTVKRIDKLPLPAFPRRPPPSIPGQVGLPPTSPISSTPSTAIPERRGRTSPPTLPPNRRTIAPPPSPPSTGAKQGCGDILYNRSALSKPAPDPPSIQAQGQRSVSSDYSAYEDPEDWAFDAIKTFEEIPVDIDVKGLSVEKISKVLSLMRLEGHRGAFESSCVDGELLLQLDEGILVKDFHFSSFDAKKLMMFTKGWRPKKS